MRKLLMFLALSACAAQEVPKTIYRCENPDGGRETIVKARFYEGGAEIDVNGLAKHDLKRDISASGARYAADGIEFWTNGRTATLTSFGASTDCMEE